MKAKNQPERQSPETQSQTTEEKKKYSVVDLLKLIRPRIEELWHDPNGEPYMTIVGQHNLENHHLRSRELRKRIKRAFYLRLGIILSDYLLDDALEILGAEALYEGKTHPVHIRCAYHKATNKIYVDLCNDRWEAIEIDESGYRLAEAVPVKFRRCQGMARMCQVTCVNDRLLG